MQRSKSRQREILLPLSLSSWAAAKDHALPVSPPLPFPHHLSPVTFLFDNSLSFHQHNLRKNYKMLVFNKICSGPKSDIFSPFVFNNFCRLTFKFHSPFLELDRLEGKLTHLISMT
jgi:hypothetical protein